MVLGTTKLNGRNDLVDTVRRDRCSVTIFLGETRIATNIKNPDGSRGTGTKLAAGAVHDAVLRDGRSYSGPTTILGASYLAVYKPIRDAQAQTIGILFVGVPLARPRFHGPIEREAVISALVIALVAGLGYFWTLRANIRPLRADRRDASHRGRCVGQCGSLPRRTDQIGEMAQALLQLRDASARARSLEEAAASACQCGGRKARCPGRHGGQDRGGDDQGDQRSRRPHRCDDSGCGGNERFRRTNRQFRPECCDSLGTGAGQRADGRQRRRATQRFDPRDRRPGARPVRSSRAPSTPEPKHGHHRGTERAGGTHRRGRRHDRRDRRKTNLLALNARSRPRVPARPARDLPSSPPR